MPKPHTVFICQQCGYRSPRWMGRCPDCREWNSLEERTVRDEGGERSLLEKGRKDFSAPIPITRISEKGFARLLTTIQEFDRILGGGIVPGSLVLLGGDPGIGKSTLVLQACANIGRHGHSVLYVSGEESVEQIQNRAVRLDALSDHLHLATETCVENILAQVQQLNPSLLVIDSIQTASSETLTSAPGSISQIREVAQRLLEIAKRENLSVFIIGHVTKEGSLAGPRALEHVVDTVIYFEGERQNAYRILRATKNRFGSTDEIGIFEMTEKGLREVENPSQHFLSERSLEASGSVVVPVMEGTRPLLIELQALVTSTNVPIPRKMTTGVDSNRAQLLMAVLEKRVGIHFHSADVYINVPGGIQVDETAADLGIAAALLSSHRNRPIPKEIVVVGEVGLVGEVRAVSHIERRMREAAYHGFSRCILPLNNQKRATNHWGMELVGLERIEKLSSELFKGN